MRVLIWGGDSWSNQGDAAVLAGTLAGIRAILPEASVLVASDQPEVTSLKHGVSAVRRASVGFFRALWQTDLLLWGGGQMIQNASSKPFLFVHLLLLTLALLLGKRVVCFAQGVGPVSGKISRFWMRLVIGRLELITVRDHASAQRFRALGVAPRSAHVTADPSSCFAPGPQEEAVAALRRVGVVRPFAAIAVRRWGHYRGGWLPVRFSRRSLPRAHQLWFGGFCRDLAAVADYCCSKLGLDVLFVPMCPGGDQEDDAIARAIRDAMRHRDHAYVLEEVLSPALLKSVLGQAELVVAMRTHAGMLAADAGVPVAAISYQGKGQALMEELDLTPYVLPVEQVNRGNLLDLLQRVWRDRASIRGRLRSQLPDLRKRAWENFELVAKMSLSPKGSKHQGGSLAVLDAARWARLTQGVGRPADALFAGRLSALLLQRRRICLELAQPGPGDVVLDLGCGSGHYCGPIIATQARWIGLDTSGEMLSFAKASCAEEARLLRGDLRQLPFADASASVALCVGVLDYLRPHELLPALEELTRVLQSGGRLVLTCNEAWWGQALRGRLPGRVPPFLRGSGRSSPQKDRLLDLLTELELHLVAVRHLPGGILGPITGIFLCQKESQPCVSAATIEQSWRRI